MLSLANNLLKENPLQDLLSSVNAVISSNDSIITGHMEIILKITRHWIFGQCMYQICMNIVVSDQTFVKTHEFAIFLI